MPKVDINQKDKNNHTPLHIAAFKGYFEICIFLTLQKRININCLDEKGETPLHYASKSGKNEIVSLLCSKKIDINSKNISSFQTIIFIFFIWYLFLNFETPLHLASINGHLNVIKYLSELSNIDINAKDKFGINFFFSRHLF